MSLLATMVVFGNVLTARPSLAPEVPHMTAPVVHIRSIRHPQLTSLPFVERLLPQPAVHAVGSGVIIERSGLILTNDHIVDGADSLVVTVQDRDLPGRVVGRDPGLDIALVRVDAARPLPQAKLGSSSHMRVGDFVVAVGNPFGLDHTVTSGILSARLRTIATGRPPLLQTDASINPGNSGGPLYDLDGRVIGINTAVVAGANGIGFAVPIDLVKRALPQLTRQGRITRGFLGVRFGEVPPELAHALGIPHPRGALISGVMPDGPGARAGLQPGDVLLRWDGERIESSESIPEQVALTPPGTRVRVELVRLGSPRSIEVRMGDPPSEPPEP
jgi:serine protease Do